MKDYKITAVSFSSAGGTARAVRDFCEKLDFPAEYIDVTKPQNEVEARTFGETDLFVAAAPVYAGHIPAVDGLFTQFTGRRTPCVIVAAYGNRHYDDALAQLKHQLQGQGFVCIGAIACITPHVFAPALGQGRPNAEDLAVIGTFAGKIREKLEAGTVAEAEVPGNETPEIKPSKPVEKRRDETLCVQCGRCAELCPVQAIDLANLAFDNDVCINCLNCVHVCGVHAITYSCEDLKNLLEGKFSQPREVEFFV